MLSSLSSYRFASTSTGEEVASNESFASVATQGLSFDLSTETESKPNLTEVLSDASSNITSYWDTITWYEVPSYAIQNVVELVHNTGMPWWAAIIATSVASRLLLSPTTKNQLRDTNKNLAIRPALEAYAAKFKHLEPVQQAQKRFDFMGKYGVSLLTPILGMFLQMPLMLSMFHAFRTLGARFPELESGGALWFMNLGVPDPYYVLPILSAFSLYVTMDLSSNPQMKNVMIGLCVLTAIGGTQLSSGVALYWMSNFFTTFFVMKALRHPVLADYFGIVDPKDPHVMQKLDRMYNVIAEEPKKQPIRRVGSSMKGRQQKRMN